MLRYDLRHVKELDIVLRAVLSADTRSTSRRL